MRRLVMPALLAVGVLLSATACAGGDDDGPGVATLADDGGSGGDDGDGGDDQDGGELTPEELEEQALAFAACMRENGVDMPDPEVDEDGRLQLRMGEMGEMPDPAALDRAMTACEDERPDMGGQFSAEDRSEMQDRVLAFAACMRENGIDMPDPDFGDGGMIRFGPPEGVDPSDPEYLAAQETCTEEAGLDDALPGGS